MSDSENHSDLAVILERLTNIKEILESHTSILSRHDAKVQEMEIEKSSTQAKCEATSAKVETLVLDVGGLKDFRTQAKTGFAVVNGMWAIIAALTAFVLEWKKK